MNPPYFTHSLAWQNISKNAGRIEAAFCAPPLPFPNSCTANTYRIDVEAGELSLGAAPLAHAYDLRIVNEVFIVSQELLAATTAAAASTHAPLIIAASCTAVAAIAMITL